MTIKSTISFDAWNAKAALEAASAEEIDALPFGVIRIAADGTVKSYNRAESAGTGLSAGKVIGTDFFGEVAPCLSVPEFRGMIESAARRGLLDLVLGHTGDPRDPARVSQYRVLSASGGGYWVLTQR